MCNEYRFRQPLDRIVEEFSQLKIPVSWTGGAPNLEPQESIRPTDPAPVLVGALGGGAELRRLRWGFTQPKGGPVINFRSENRRLGKGRCLVPADGFYEFTGAKYPKSKWLFTATDNDFFCLAGLVREDRFTILTAAPGPDIAPYHDRQVVILPRSDWAAWLGQAPEHPAPGPAPAGTLRVEQIH